MHRRDVNCGVSEEPSLKLPKEKKTEEKKYSVKPIYLEPKL